MKPINIIDNKSARYSREIRVRPITQSGIDKMRSWLMEETFENVYKAETAHEKAAIFQEMLMTKFESIFQKKLER